MWENSTPCIASDMWFPNHLWGKEVAAEGTSTLTHQNSRIFLTGRIQDVYCDIVYNGKILETAIKRGCCSVASVMSDSVRPHRRQPTRLPCPWDSPGKNTGVSCHFLLQCMKVKTESEVDQSCPTLSDPMDCSLPGSSIHGIFQARVLEWGAIAFSINRG